MDYQLFFLILLFSQTEHDCLTIRVQGILKAVGVEGGVAAAGVVETGDLLDLWNQVTGNIGLG